MAANRGSFVGLRSFDARSPFTVAGIFQTISKNYDVLLFNLNYCNLIEYDKMGVICSIKMLETSTIWIEVLVQCID